MAIEVLQAASTATPIHSNANVASFSTFTARFALTSSTAHEPLGFGCAFPDIGVRQGEIKHFSVKNERVIEKVTLVVEPNVC